MDYAYQTDKAVNELIRFKISFNKSFNTYLLNDKWINEIDEYYYSEKIENIKKLLHKQLVNGLNHKEYLQNLLDLIWNKIDHVERFKCYSPEFFELYSGKIKTIDFCDNEPTLNIDLYEKYKVDSSSTSENESELFSFLKFHSEKMNDYNTQLDFEKSLLLYTINIHRDALKDLYDFIYSIHMNAKYIDFKNLTFEDFQESNPKKKKERLCHINLDKKSVAHLFRILIEEDLLVFDELNEANNRLELKRFVENNFTYQNTGKKRVPIKSFNREYSEVSSPSSPEVKKHKEFIDKLILMLQNRKNYLKD